MQYNSYFLEGGKASYIHVVLQYTIDYDVFVLTENTTHSHLNLHQTYIISKSAAKFLLCLTSSQNEADSFITQLQNPTCIHLESCML